MPARKVKCRSELTIGPITVTVNGESKTLPRSRPVVTTYDDGMTVTDFKPAAKAKGRKPKRP